MLPVKELLERVGFKLSNDGNSYRSSAFYRGGKNNNSISIDKKTGLYYDFGISEGGNIKQLIEYATGKHFETLDDFLLHYNLELTEEETEEILKPKIKMVKVWDKSELKNLFPHYTFYERKGISQDTLRYFQGGFCHSGKMQKRFVFPIYGKDQKIYGWAGRDLSNQSDKKWKLIGSKKNWIYPAYIKAENDKFLCLDEIKKQKQLIIVESIGDMLALWERGVRNVLVCFGLTISSKQGSFIMSLDLDEIIIATNNDLDKKENSGKIAAIKIYMSLFPYIDLDLVKIALPNSNDFGDMSDEQFLLWQNKCKSVSQKLILEAVKKYIFNLKSNNKKITKQTEKILKYTKIKLDTYDE